MFFPLLSFVLTQVQCGAVGKGSLAGPRDSLSKIPRVFSEPLTGAGLQSGMNFLSVLGCFQ